ncbi:MAG: hypothetical protein ACTHLO_10640 [Pseudolabrys sp.]
MTFAKFTAAAAGLVLVASMLVASAPARAADDNDDDTPIDTKILRGILEGIGLERDGKNTIDYHERPPLVIPGSKALPAPQSSDAVIANTPAWPKDPDVARARQARIDAKKGVHSEEIDAWGRPLSPAEMMPGGDRGRTGPAPKIVNPAGADGTRLSADELGYRGGLFGSMFGGKQERSVRFTGEPARTSLTQPPSGYQTPSPDQPYGEGKSDSAPKAADATDQRIEGATR